MSDAALADLTKRRSACVTDYTAKERADISRKARAEITRRFDEIAETHGYTKHDYGWDKLKGALLKAVP